MAPQTESVGLIERRRRRRHIGTGPRTAAVMASTAVEQMSERASAVISRKISESRAERAPTGSCACRSIRRQQTLILHDRNVRRWFISTVDRWQTESWNRTNSTNCSQTEIEITSVVDIRKIYWKQIPVTFNIFNLLRSQYWWSVELKKQTSRSKRHCGLVV